jgi:hypothetical protein
MLPPRFTVTVLPKFTSPAAVYNNRPSLTLNLLHGFQPRLVFLAEAEESYNAMMEENEKERFRYSGYA